MRSGTDYHPTHVIVVRLVAVIIETGLFTCAYQVIFHVLYVAWGWRRRYWAAIIVITHLTLFVAKNIWFIVPGVSMSKAYTITMLVLLNRRKDDRERMNQGRRSGSVSSASGGPASPSSLRQVGMGQGGGITVGPTALRVRLPDYPGPASTIPLYQTLDGSNGNLISSAGKSEAWKRVQPQTTELLRFPYLNIYGSFHEDMDNGIPRSTICKLKQKEYVCMYVITGRYICSSRLHPSAATKSMQEARCL